MSLQTWSGLIRASEDGCAAASKGEGWLVATAAGAAVAFCAVRGCSPTGAAVSELVGLSERSVVSQEESVVTEYIDSESAVVEEIDPRRVSE